MSKVRIALMAGDGIGKDVMDSAVMVLDAFGLDVEYVHADIGWECWRKEGNSLPERTIDILNSCKCALFGAATSKPKDDASKELIPKLQGKGFVYESPIVKLRQHFQLHTNFRPCKSYFGNPFNYRNDIDMVIFRENTEGLYAGIEFYPLPNEVRSVLTDYSPAMSKFREVPSEEISISLRVITKKAAQRIIQHAFEYAEKHGHSTVTLVEKANVLRETSGMMVREARRVASRYSNIRLIETNIDAQMMWLLKKPKDFGILVSSNMFGDILSDLATQLVGGLGFAASGNIGDNFAVFEPVHGSAPKYAGSYKANPIGMILAIKLMFDWLEEYEKGSAIENAVADVISEGRVRTNDMGGTASTLEMSRAVLERL